jgi:DNA invertase Pin-like site-specific DNA recombinase
MTPKKSLRAVGYARLSNLTDETTSPARQRAAIEAKCAAKGWHLVEVVEDLDVSASKARTRLDRPDLDRVRAMVAAKEADVVVVWKLDRLARSVVALSTLSAEWEAHGAALASTAEEFDTTTAAGRMMRNLLGTFAEFEADTIRDRVLSARAHLAKSEKWPGGAAPFGYRSVPHESGSGRALVVDPEEAEVVRQAADEVLGGASCYAVVKRLNAEGVKPRKAAAWSISSLKIVLTGDAALGRLTHRREVVRDAHGLPIEVWEPILPVADVERLRVLLAAKPLREQRRHATRLLSGLLRCHRCGTTLRVNSTSTRSGERLVRYTCKGDTDGPGCPAPVSIAASPVEDYVLREAVRLFGDDPVLYEIREADTSTASRLAALREAIADTARAMTAPDADVQALVSRLSSLKAALVEEEAKPSVPVVRMIDSGQTFAEIAERADDADALPEVRDRLSALLSGPIVLHPGRRGLKGIQADRLEIPWRDEEEEAAS